MQDDRVDVPCFKCGEPMEVHIPHSPSLINYALTVTCICCKTTTHIQGNRYDDYMPGGFPGGTPTETKRAETGEDELSKQPREEGSS